MERCFRKVLDQYVARYMKHY